MRLRRSTVIFTFLSLLAFAPTLYASEADMPEAPAELWMAIPFVLLLASIAIMPFINRHWWERRYPFVAFSLGAMVVLLYLIVLQNSERVVHTANEYFSFIVLIGSLFIVAGGIHIKIRGRSTPHSNVLLLLIGGITANLLGTTGASMVLIRPYLRVNRYRLRPYHVVFFIFVVSNVGGITRHRTPVIGFLLEDPPKKNARMSTRLLMRTVGWRRISVISLLEMTTKPPEVSQSGEENICPALYWTIFPH
jgi:hypothetical protein